jgi:hypothetical protein
MREQVEHAVRYVLLTKSGNPDLCQLASRVYDHLGLHSLGEASNPPSPKAGVH